MKYIFSLVIFIVISTQSWAKEDYSLTVYETYADY
ncbi:MAG: hypothetical protein ACJAVL_001493, partial [Bacteroidia bacterium]